MRSFILLLLVVLNIGYSLGNGLGPTSFYFLPLKAVSIDRDALAVYAPGGSVGIHTTDTKKVFLMTWTDCSITITQQTNDAITLKSDYGRFVDLAPEGLRKEITAAMECEKIMKIEVNRAAFPTVVHAARQIIVCDKLHQLGGGFILTSQGMFESDGSLICGEPTAPANLFFPPRRP